MAQGTMERITALVKSNLNEVLDRVEDPVKMVDQIVRDVEDSVDQAIAALGRAKASERRCAREVQRNTEAIRGWWTKAEKAVGAGDEEFARLVLEQKARLEQIHTRLESALAESRETVGRLRVQVGELRDKLGEVRTRREKLVVRHRAGKWCDESPGSEMVGEVGAVDRLAAIDARVKGRERELARFEEQVEELVAASEVQRDFDEEHRAEEELLQVERERRVADELASLKADKAS